MDPHIGDGDAPFGQLLVQIDVIHKGPAGQEVAFEVLHPRLNLAFRQGRQLHGISRKRSELFA